MAAAATKPKRGGITSIQVSGIKSLAEQQTIEIAPLTVLAGVNSSGKSSIMQGLLLLKQTIEAPFDPGALFLNGPNARFTSANQLLSRQGAKSASSLTVGIETGASGYVQLSFTRQPGNRGFKLEEMSLRRRNRVTALKPELKGDELIKVLGKGFFNNYPAAFVDENTLELVVGRDRCFLSVEARNQIDRTPRMMLPLSIPGIADFKSQLRSLIHLPGLRGNPERTYLRTSVGPTFPGTFDQYVASVIATWQTEKNTKMLTQVGQALQLLGLTWKVEAKAINDTQVELRVGRLPQKGSNKDMVSIADVGFGVSQTLPVVVALLIARPGQMVYLEQPEIHLHPRAQVALAQLLCQAADRGVRVVVETHSSLLLRGIQTAVAEGSLAPDTVKLHWFSRRPEDGATQISTAGLDETGAFGDFPIDFDDVNLALESQYLDAAERRLLDHSDH